MLLHFQHHHGMFFLATLVEVTYSVIFNWCCMIETLFIFTYWSDKLYGFDSLKYYLYYRFLKHLVGKFPDDVILHSSKIKIRKKSR